MEFNIIFTPKVREEIHELKEDKSMKDHLKEIHQALDFLSHNPRHPSLHTHKYNKIKGEDGEEVFEAYAENDTPGAYRIFWHYGPGRGVITVVDIIHHP